ncbi:MAG: hypothetical protein EA425_11785 [Puniceicoccaceae bacterium]|nr:MAG: hypothetical protein EA425_11785 [Puniceicoccaceae bacterium]
MTTKLSSSIPFFRFVCLLALAVLAGAATLSAHPHWGPARDAVSPGEVVGWGRNFGEPPEPIMDAVAVAVAQSLGGHLALRADGTIVGWGSPDIANVPAGLKDAVAIAAGNFHCLALRADGTVVGWGNNASGRATPPTGLTDVVAIAAGSTHSLALRADGTVVGWGNDTSGQATPPEGLAEVKAIAADGPYSAALLADGTLQVWGLRPEYIPADAVVPDAVDLVAGPDVLVAVTGDGEMYRFGRPDNLPPSLTGLRALALGHGRSLAVVGEPQNTFPISVQAAAGGTVTVQPQKSLYFPGESVWLDARASHGYLFLKWTGDVAGTRGLVTATLSPGFAAMAQFEPIDVDAELVGWGSNDFGVSRLPIDMAEVAAIAAGGGHNLALLNDGTVFGWGMDWIGQATPPSGLAEVTAIAGGSRHSLALRADGTVAGWGDDSSGQATAPAGLADVTGHRRRHHS